MKKPTRPPGRILRIAAIPLVMFLILGGCGRSGNEAGQQQAAPDSSAGPESVTCVFESDDGFEVVADLQEESAWVFLPGRTLELERVPSGSGEKFSDGEVTLWRQGEEAILLRAGQADIHLRNNRQRAVWEHAKLAGMDFRAVGNEPGWVLEIWEGGRVVFRGDYGQSVHEFTGAEPINDQDARTTTYICRNDGHELVVLLSATPCRDTMADQEYETTVTVTLDGKEFHGCGQALH